MHDADPIIVRRIYAVNIHFFAINENAALILFMYSAQNLDQCRLSRAILAQKRMRLAFSEFEANVF